MRHPLSHRPVVRERVVAETPGVARTLPSLDLESLLSVPPREVVLLLPGRRLVFGRVVGRLRLQRWGCTGVEALDPSTIVNACVASVREWQAMHRISDAQRRGLHIVRVGSCSAVIEHPEAGP